MCHSIVRNERFNRAAVTSQNLATVVPPRLRKKIPRMLSVDLLDRRYRLDRSSISNMRRAGLFMLTMFKTVLPPPSPLIFQLMNKRPCWSSVNSFRFFFHVILLEADFNRISEHGITEIISSRRSFGHEHSSFSLFSFSSSIFVFEMHTGVQCFGIIKWRERGEKEKE